MPHTMPLLGIALTALLLGIRHGLDWDHLSAIADLVGGPIREGARALATAAWYCIGHALVIVALGLLVGIVGIHMPGFMDRPFEIAVGISLALLGCLVLWQVIRDGRNYRFTSRWHLAAQTLNWAFRRQLGRDLRSIASAGPSNLLTFWIGVLHGSGAETPTQVLLFASAAAVGSVAGNVLVLLAFVAGLVLADLLVAAALLTGRLRSVRIPYGNMVLGAVTAVVSITIGVLFVLQKAEMLPNLVGG